MLEVEPLVSVAVAVQPPEMVETVWPKRQRRRRRRRFRNIR